ncbi:MAG: HAMP domain-containing histidine kinase [Clostridiales bacterium]|nr:HAMP domain-containing histidine kinase [Clostridiales bacterium]
MIRKLRAKFILLAMALVLLLLVILIGAINTLNYRLLIADSDTIIEALMGNNGIFPDWRDMSEKHFEGRRVSAELSYESRHFAVCLDKDGEVLYTDTQKIAAIDADTAIEYARTVVESGKDQGLIDNYRYLLREDEEDTLVVFMDCSRELDAAHLFLITSVQISLCGYLIVFVLLLYFSGWIVKPVSESYEKQKQFITDASHELKTPLTIIGADLDVLEMDGEDNEWLQDIRFQTRRLAELTNDLVTLSRMEEGGRYFHMADFSISDVADELTQSFQGPAIAQNKTFDIDIEPLITMRGDEKSLRQLISIFLENALKYSDAAGTITFTLRKSRNGRSVKITVYNTCESIAKDEIPHLFERFYRTDKSRNSQTGGHGIGLSIAKAIVTAHRGTVSASTSDGKSLTISASLPLTQKADT